MALFLPQRWRRQPQGPVEVNLNHPIGGKIHYATAPWLSATSLLPGKRVRVASSLLISTALTQPMTVPTLRGQALNVHAQTGYNAAGLFLDDNDIAYPLATSTGAWQGSLFAVVDGLKHNGTGAEAFARFRTGGDFIGFTATTRFFYTYIFSGTRGTGTVSVPDFYVGSMAFNFGGTGTSTFGKFYLGRVVAYEADHGNYNINTFRGWRTITQVSPTYMRIPFSFRSDLLTEDEVFALDESPYQVLKPQRQVFYSLPAAALQFARPSSDILVGAWQGVTA